MVFKLINATEVRVGTSIIVDGKACVVKKADFSTPGRHGHAKLRAEAEGIIDGKKRVLVVPGHERFEVPRIEKRKGQVLSIKDKVSIMDSDSYETLEIAIPSELKDDIKEGDDVEYWDIEGEKIVKRKL